MFAFPAIAAPKASARNSRERERPRTMISPSVENTHRPSGLQGGKQHPQDQRALETPCEHHPRHVAGDDMAEFMGKKRVDLVRR